MRPYFEKMDPLGTPLTPPDIDEMADNRARIAAMLAELETEVSRVKSAGLPAEKIRERGDMTVWDRIEYLVDPGTFCPLHTLYNPRQNEEGTTGVVDGLGRIGGKWCVVIGFDNKVMAGAWIGGQAENQLRVADLAKRLRVPLVWLVNCSGVKLTHQDEVSRSPGGGTMFFRHAELEQAGVPVIAGSTGRIRPAAVIEHQPTMIFAHKNANMAVRGGGIVSGMSPKGSFDEAGAEQIIAAARHSGGAAGSARVHHDATGFFRAVFDTEAEVLDALEACVAQIPAYAPAFFRVAAPPSPASRSPTSPPSSPSTRRRSTASRTCWPGSSMAASTWSSGRPSGPRCTPASSRSTGCWSG
jgi:glutaconyl-CoA decarboxylase